MARKTNVTGIKGLSIGTTKNDRDYLMTRYIVNHKIDDKPVAKAFYFGKNCSQKNAFNKAVIYMRKQGLLGADVNTLGIYNSYEHDSILNV